MSLHAPHLPQKTAAIRYPSGVASEYASTGRTRRKISKQIERFTDHWRSRAYPSRRGLLSTERRRPRARLPRTHPDPSPLRWRARPACDWSRRATTNGGGGRGSEGREETVSRGVSAGAGGKGEREEGGGRSDGRRKNGLKFEENGTVLSHV